MYSVGSWLTLASPPLFSLCALFFFQQKCIPTNQQPAAEVLIDICDNSFHSMVALTGNVVINTVMWDIGDIFYCEKPAGNSILNRSFSRQYAAQTD